MPSIRSNGSTPFDGAQRAAMPVVGWPHATTGRSPPPVQALVGAITTADVSSGAPCTSVEWYITRQATVP
jgi:hypothetical protein